MLSVFSDCFVVLLRLAPPGVRGLSGRGDSPEVQVLMLSVFSDCFVVLVRLALFVMVIN